MTQTSIRAGAPSGPGHPEGPRLLADIGVTHARLALEGGPARLEQGATLACGDYDSLLAVISAYLEGIEGERPRYAIIAIANPIQGDEVCMTNRDWHFSIEATRQALDLDILLVVNDFTALAMALPHLSGADCLRVGQQGAPRPGTIGLIGPGSGLGVSGLIPSADHWVTLGSEGGHVSFAPGNARELDILRYAWDRYGHVSSERLLSGPGLELIWQAQAAGSDGQGHPTAADIVARALAGERAAGDVVDLFCGMLGSAAGDLALTLGAVGGIYIGGGLVPRLGKRLAASPFRQRFEAKGRFSDYLKRIPTYLITRPDPSLIGVSAILDQHLRSVRNDSVLLDRVRAAMPGMGAAGQRVARFLLSQPNSFAQDPIAQIARSAGVSQPTVIRFCRALGCTGLLDFKRKLALGLSRSVPLRHSQVNAGDRAPDLSAKVLDNTVSAILRLRDTLDAQAVERAIGILRRARRIEWFGAADAGIVVQDGQEKFCRLGIPSAAYPHARIEKAAAGLLTADDAVVAVSGSGADPELLETIATAGARGVRVVAVTRADSPLGRAADVCLAVDHTENSAGHLTMMSRILHLLMLDVMAVGVALEAPQARTETARPSLLVPHRT
ncbi:MAG: glucokinase [Castellaniella sp.]|uniref:glucokinase n=1 Tax=Castellaniella sp. TaxID=1955812 RepID=UPI003C72FD73